ncbi:sterol-binding protein [Umbelopsis nana]
MVKTIAQTFACTVILFDIVSSVVSQSNGADYLSVHNARRGLHKDTPTLVYDSVLEASAKHHVGSCVFQLSDDTNDVGENIAKGYNTWDSVVDLWYSGITHYDPNNPEKNAAKTS